MHSVGGRFQVSLWLHLHRSSNWRVLCQLRLRWTILWEWRVLTFNDERRFCVNRADRRERGWRGPGEERECHGLTDVSYDYRTSLVSINGHLNAQRRSSSCCSMWQCLFSSGCYCRHSVPARQCSYSRQRSCSNTTSCVAMTSELTSSQPNERFVTPSGAESILPGAFCSHHLTISDQRPAHLVQTLLITADSSATFESDPHLILSSTMSSLGRSCLSNNAVL